MARRRRSNIGFNTSNEVQPGESPQQPKAAGGVDHDMSSSAGDEDASTILPVFGAPDTGPEADEELKSNFSDDAYFNDALLKDHLAGVNIADRTGNYLISVGLPGSGKTVLQSFTTYSMSVAGDLSAKPDIAEVSGEINYQAQQLRSSWLDEWKVGNFPKGTPLKENEIREIRLSIDNLKNRSQKFNFSFLEVAGENFKDVVPTAVSAPMLFDRINAFLTNKKLRLNIAFVLKTDEKLGETIFF